MAITGTPQEPSISVSVVRVRLLSTIFGHCRSRGYSSVAKCSDIFCAQGIFGVIMF